MALSLGLYQIGDKSIWHDEALTASFVSHGLRHLLGILPTYDVHDDLYYLVLSPWIKFAGDGETAIRAPSAVFAAGSAALLYLVALSLADQRIALGAAALLVGSEMFLAYAQEARSYAFALFLVTASTLAILRVASQPRSWLRLAVYVPLAVMAIYAHLWTGFAIAAQLLWVASKARRPALVGGCFIAALVSPLIVYGLLNGTPGWIPELNLETATWAFLSLAGGSWPRRLRQLWQSGAVRGSWLVVTASWRCPCSLPYRLHWA